MVTVQDRQQSRDYLVKWKRRNGKKHRLMIRLCLYCLLVGIVCLSIAKIASGLSLTSNDENLALGIVPPSSKGYIVLDPGHGGDSSHGGDPGSVHGGILERDITLDLSLLIKDELVKRGYNVMMTRDEDEAVTLKQRAEITNKSGADLFMSIHLNAHEDASVFGTETWFNPKTNTQNSALAQYVHQSFITSTQGKDRGTYSDTSFYLTRKILIPSCLVEVGYLSNDQERAKMTTKAYREKIVQGISDGVEQYFKEFPSSQSQANDW